MVDEENFKLPSPEPLDEDENFQILSLFQEHELGNLKSDSVIVKAMNSVADLFYNHRRSPPTWKILGVPKRCESDLLDRLNLHSKLDVVLARMPSDKRLKDELCQCHLVLVPPSSDHYVNLTLASMCAAVPIIIPWRSQSHELIQRHLRRHEIWLVVDMSEGEPLREGIMRYLCNYKVALKKAKDIRNDVRNQVRQELESINDTFFEVVKEDADVIHGVILQRQKSPEEKQQDNEDDKENQGTTKESGKSSRKRKWQGRDPGVMKVKVQVSEVVPESGKKVEEVERGFYESEEVNKKSEEVGRMLDEQHDQMKVKDIGHESISYTMACQSLDALECLKRKYENGKIQDLMEDEFLSDELLDKIGAYYLAIDVTIDYEEYLMCRKELIQMYGEPVNDGQQERDIQSMGESHESETSQEKIDGAARRVNRARYLLKSFEKEGGKVTENQINMLDQLLKEKEEKRQLVHKRSLQASWVEEIVHGEHIQRGSSGILRPHDSELSQATNLHQLTEDQITDLNEGLKSEIAKQTHDGRVARAMHRERGRGRDIWRSSLVEGKKLTEREFNPLFSEFIQVKTDMRELETNRPEATIKNEKLLADVEAIVQDADIDEEMKELYIEKEGSTRGFQFKILSGRYRDMVMVQEKSVDHGHWL
ncbi:trichohyalin-like [Ptychodera flava]|uniref:trichohyalin-like n=1 Tax=Ptychodera flava TaxID=63121 RepID=UPI003969D92E